MRRISTVDLMLLATVLLWALNFTVTKYVADARIPAARLRRDPLRGGRGDLRRLACGARAGLRDQQARLDAARDRAAVSLAQPDRYVYALKLTTATTVALILGTTPIFAALGRLRARARAADPAASGSRPRSGSPASRSSRSARAAASRGTSAATCSRSSPRRPGPPTRCGRAADAPLLAVPDQRGRARSSAGSRSRAHGSHQLSPRSCGPARLAGLASASPTRSLGPLVLTNVLWFTAVGRVGPSRATLFANIQPFFAAVFAVLLLSEHLHLGPGRRRRRDRGRASSSRAAAADQTPSRTPLVD